MRRFSANIGIIGINPFVELPEKVLAAVLKAAGKDKGPIRVRGTINGDPYRQTLLRYKGEWRLYINGFMLKNSPRRIGEKIVVEIVRYIGSLKTVESIDRNIMRAIGHLNGKAGFAGRWPRKK